MFSYLLGKDHHVCVQGENSFSLGRFARPLATGLVTFLLAIGMHLPALAACPPAEKLQMDIERLTRRKGEITQDREALQSARNLGRRLVELGAVFGV